MDKYERLAAEIIDAVSYEAEKQHPEIILKTKITKEAGIDEPALICGNEYYNLESSIAKDIEWLVKSEKEKIVKLLNNEKFLVKQLKKLTVKKLTD